MKKIRLFLVGVGGYGANYVRLLSALQDPDVCVEGICEVAPGAAERHPMVAEQHIPVYRTIEEFYREHDADLAVISTPIHLHHGQVLQCLENGSHALVEKPVCTSLQEAEDMLRAQERTGRFVSVGYQTNYSRAVLALKRDILAGKFGRPLYFCGYHGYRRGDAYYRRNNWAGRVRVNGAVVNDSPLNNSNAHQFQNMLFLLGNAMDRAAEVTQVEAELYRANPLVENFDTAGVHVLTAAGVPVQYCTTHNCREPELGPFSEFCFEKATVWLGKSFGQGLERSYVAQWADGTREVYGALPQSLDPEKLTDAIACARSGGHPVCTVQAAMPHLQVIERLATLPVWDIPRDQVEDWDLDGDRMHHVRGIEEVFERCFKERKLPEKAFLHKSE